MKNPNAVAAWLAAHAVIAGEALAERYLHHTLPGFWAQELTADVTTTVLYVGRHGLEFAALRALGSVRALWAGTAPAA